MNFDMSYVSPLIFLYKFVKDIKLDAKNSFLARFLYSLFIDIY